MCDLRIIVPCYNEENLVEVFYNQLMDNVNDLELNIELIFVNDGSNDNTLENIRKLDGAKYISFSRNFGKEAALYAGLQHCRGDYVVIMDVDLQDPPSLLPEMIETIKGSDYDIVATRRVTRNGEPLIKSFFARTFYKFINGVSNLNLVDGARDYRIMTRQVADAILELDEYNRFSKGLFNWIGFETCWLEYENVERADGETSWTFWKLFSYSIDAIVGFTTVPLSVSTYLGLLFSVIAFIFIIFIIVRKLLFNDPVQGWASTVCIILLLGGIQLFTIGILGKYLEKTYLEAKNRPIYIVKESNID